MIIDIVLALIVSVFCSVVSGGYLSVRLPLFNRVFDRKPFNCRPCFTFHLTWGMMLLFAFAAHSLPMFVVGIVAAFVVFVLVKHIDKKKIEE